MPLWLGFELAVVVVVVFDVRWSKYTGKPANVLKCELKSQPSAESSFRSLSSEFRVPWKASTSVNPRDLSVAGSGTVWATERNVGTSNTTNTQSLRDINFVIRTPTL